MRTEGSSWEERVATLHLYRRAMELGLAGSLRRQAVIQLASSLRSIGRAEESVALLSAERTNGSDELTDAVDAFLALALADVGEERYKRSLANYARLLTPGAET
jgi:Tetratrico peptide repeat